MTVKIIIELYKWRINSVSLVFGILAPDRPVIARHILGNLRPRVRQYSLRSKVQKVNIASSYCEHAYRTRRNVHSKTKINAGMYSEDNRRARKRNKYLHYLSKISCACDTISQEVTCISSVVTRDDPA